MGRTYILFNMAPIMFKYNRSYMTTNQWSLSVKTFQATQNPLTCAAKYSQYANSIQGARIAPNNCTQEQRVYNSKGQLIGKNFCVLSFT
jgi:hypothetical protein